MNQTFYKKKFRVSSPNPYENEEGAKTVKVYIQDVLFNNTICSLVCINDLTEYSKSPQACDQDNEQLNEITEQ